MALLSPPERLAHTSRRALRVRRSRTALSGRANDHRHRRSRRRIAAERSRRASCCPGYSQTHIGTHALPPLRCVAAAAAPSARELGSILVLDRRSARLTGGEQRAQPSVASQTAWK